ncbi:MAG: divalent-cation tolerance protein CutA [Gammaproteobacteria bacterium]|jgi:periplasmic divalent cation tolerance protein
MTTSPQLVLCSVPDRDTATHLARTLVTERLAACVTIVPGVSSVYRWEGAVEESDELLLLIKTCGTVFDPLKSCICARHPYELPEIIAVPLEDGLREYLDWIATSIEEPQ